MITAMIADQASQTKYKSGIGAAGAGDAEKYNHCPISRVSPMPCMREGNPRTIELAQVEGNVETTLGDTLESSRMARDPCMTDFSSYFVFPFLINTLTVPLD